MNIQVTNRMASGQVFAYVTGHDLDSDRQWCLVKADGKTPYHPPDPPAIGTPLAESCAIKLGASGTTTTISIPHLEGGRLWFSVDKELTFLMNPGPARKSHVCSEIWPYI